MQFVKVSHLQIVKHKSKNSVRSEYIFKFDDQFEMHDDAQVLKRMGLLGGKFQTSFEKRRGGLFSIICY